MTRRYLLVLALCAGCPADPPPACTMVDTACAPGYQPTFHNVYQNTLQVSCGADNSSCHNAAGHQGNLSFAGDETAVYTALLSDSSLDPSRKRVVAGDPACSLLTVRTEGVGADYQMPKGDPLRAAERCALVQWIQAGALP
jgi:hypothetical protein